jgi:predicted ATPase/DNA-binding XRE family transcriptional regulator
MGASEVWSNDSLNSPGVAVQKNGVATPARSFGELLRDHRLAAGLAQETLAERAHLSVETISALERGTRQRPYLDTIALLANALELSEADRAELERAAKRRASPTVMADLKQLRTNLPPPLSSFVGREQDVAKIKELLANQRLVTLVGAGGVGKTRIALEVGLGLLDGPHDYVWFVDLSTFADASNVAIAIAGDIGLKHIALLDPLLNYLRPKNFLMLLDNCEHLLGGVPEAVSEILRACAGGKILATSRQGLAIQGERIYRVPPLSCPADDAGAMSVGDALRYDGIRLFAERAAAADSRFELSPRTIPAVAEICRRVDGIALAIELVAARTKVFSPAMLLQQLDEHFLTLGSGGRALLPRHKTMWALFDWSYGLLEDTERTVFRRLSIFNGGFALELMIAVCASEEMAATAVVDALASLVDKSLVQADVQSETARYRLLEPTRQYARQLLRGRDEYGAAARAHALALLALAEEMDSSLELTPDHVWSSRVAPEGENYRAAFAWAFGPEGDAAIAQQLAGSRTGTWFGYATGHARQWVAAAFETVDATTPDKVLAKLELSRARLALDEVQPELAIAAAQRAVRYQPASDAPSLAEAQWLMGMGLIRAERIRDGEIKLREALATANLRGDKAIIPSIKQALATARSFCGDLEADRVLGWEAMRLHRAAGCERLAARDMPNLAETEFAAGNAESALQLVLEAATVLRSQRDGAYLGSALGNASVYAMALDRLGEARAYANESLRLMVEARSGLRAIWAVQHLAALDNDHVRAAHLLGFVEEQLAQVGVGREFTERYSYERLRKTLESALGERLDDLVAEGRTWPEDRAFVEALAVL